MLGLRTHQREPFGLQPCPAISEAFHRRLRAFPQAAGARDFGTNVRSALAHDRRDRAQHGADMDDVAGRTGLDQPQRRRATRKGLERGDEARDRALALGEPGALTSEHPIDDRDPRAGGGDLRLGSLDARGDRSLARSCPARAVALVRGGALESARARLGILRRLVRGLELILLLGERRGLCLEPGKADPARRGNRQCGGKESAHPYPSR